MDIFQETKVPLKNVWDDKLARQQSKIVILQAIANASEITAKVANDIFDELDNMLLEDKVDEKQNVEQGL